MTVEYPPDNIEPMLEWLRTWRDGFGESMRGATSCWNAIDEIMKDLELRSKLNAPWDARVRAGNGLGPGKITSIAGVSMSEIDSLASAFEDTENETLEEFAIAAVRAGWRPQKETRSESVASWSSGHSADCRCELCLVARRHGSAH